MHCRPCFVDLRFLLNFILINWEKKTTLLEQFQYLITNQVKRGKIISPNTQTHDFLLSWYRHFDKTWRVKLIVWAQTCQLLYYNAVNASVLHMWVKCQPYFSTRCWYLPNLFLKYKMRLFFIDPYLDTSSRILWTIYKKNPDEMRCTWLY